MLLTLDLKPAVGLGPFLLGMPFATAVHHIRERKNDFRCVEIKYADQDFLEQDLLLNLPEQGMHLRFEAHSQRLRLIEVYDISRMEVRYGTAVVGGASHPATFPRVYDLCGPTYPGEYNSADSMYVLHYPGLLFLFPIPAQHAEHCSSRSGDLPLELPDGSTPIAARICIYAGPAGSAVEVAAVQLPPLPTGSVYGEVVEASPGQGLHFSRGAQTVWFGDSPQDVWSELGMPSGTSSKPHNAMAISAGGNPGGAAGGAGGNGADFFYHYSTRTHRVKKFVLRTNVPGHALFNLYMKCNFVLHAAPPSAAGRHAEAAAGSHSTQLPWQEPEAAAAAGSYGQHAPYATTELSVASREPSDTHLSLDNGPIPPGGYLPSPSRGSSAPHKVAPTHSGSPHTPGKKLPSAIRLNGDAGLQGINTAAVQDTQDLIQAAMDSPGGYSSPSEPMHTPLSTPQNPSADPSPDPSPDPPEADGSWGWPGNLLNLGDFPFAATTSTAMNALGLADSPRTPDRGTGSSRKHQQQQRSDAAQDEHSFFGLARIAPPSIGGREVASSAAASVPAQQAHAAAAQPASDPLDDMAAQPAAAQLSQQEDADGWNDGWNDDLDADDPSTLLAAIEAPLISLADSAHEPPAADSASAVHDGPHALLNHAVDDYLQPGVKLGPASAIDRQLPGSSEQLQEGWESVDESQAESAPHLEGMQRPGLTNNSLYSSATPSHAGDIAHAVQSDNEADFAASEYAESSIAGSAGQFAAAPYEAASTQHSSKPGAGHLQDVQKRCDDLPGQGEKLQASITADSLWGDVQAVMGDAGRATIHSRGSSGNPFGPTFVYGYAGVAFEVCKNGHLASVTLFEP